MGKTYGLELFINNLIVRTNELYPNIITEDQKERLYSRFKNDPRLKTPEGYEEIKKIVSSIVENYINRYFIVKDMKSYNPAKWSDIKPSEEVIKLNNIFEVLKEYGEKPKKIVDAGAGSGRNAIYFAQKGYEVTAIDNDIESINDIKRKSIDYHVPNLEAFNINIIDYLKTQPDESIDAIIDSGMSHYFNDETKYIYYQLARQKLKPGGFYSLLHYSEFEGDKNIGRSLTDLKKLTLGTEVIIPWDEVSWLSDDRNVEIKAYTCVLRKIKGNIPTDSIKYMLWLKGNTDNFEVQTSFPINKKGNVKPIAIIGMISLLIFIGFIIGLLLF